MVVNGPIGARAHLGLARAFALEGDAAKSRAAYQAFLSLCKDGDPEVPILKQAKAEYAKMPGSTIKSFADRFRLKDGTVAR